MGREKYFCHMYKFGSRLAPECPQNLPIPINFECTNIENELWIHLTLKDGISST
jgi:hypothetical protein